MYTEHPEHFCCGTIYCMWHFWLYIPYSLYVLQRSWCNSSVSGSHTCSSHPWLLTQCQPWYYFDKRLACTIRVFHICNCSGRLTPVSPVRVVMNGGWMYDMNGGWMYDKNGLKSHRPRQATDYHIMCYNSLNALLPKRVYEAFVDDVECYLLVLCNLSIYTLFSPCHVLAHRCMLTLNLSQRRYLHDHRCQLHYVRVSSWFFRRLV